MLNWFITGSQTEAHRWRMFKEAIKFLIKIILVCILLAACISIYKIPKYNLKVWYYYHQASMLEGISKTGNLHIVNQAGKKMEVPIKYILTNKETLQIKNQVEAEVMSSIIWSLIIPALLPLWFWYQGWVRSKNKVLRGITMGSNNFVRKLVVKYNNRIFERGFWKILTLLRKVKDKILKQEFKKISYKPYILPGNIECPAYTEHQHLFVTGGSGTGKTVFLSSIIDQIKARGDIAIIYDKMGSFIPHYYEEGKDVILNPFDKRSKDWSIFNEVRPGKLEMDLTNIANGLIPLAKSGDEFWNRQARSVFIDICSELMRSGKGNNKDLMEHIFRKDFHELRDFLKNTDSRGIFESDEQMRTAFGIRSSMVTYTQFLKILKQEEPRRAKDKFSIRSFIEDSISSDEGKFLFLSSRGDMHESVQPLITCQIDIAINTLLSLKQQKERNIWIILDELPSLNQIPTLDAGLSQARQFGGSFILSMQLISQLKDVYGDKKADTMSGNCKTRVVFSSPDVNTAKWASESLGKKEIKEVKESLNFGANEIRDGVSLSHQLRMEELVIPSEIQMLPNLNFYLRLPFAFPVTRIAIKPQERERIAESLVENEIKLLEYSELSRQEELEAVVKPTNENEGNNNILSQEEESAKPTKRNMFEED